MQVYIVQSHENLGLVIDNMYLYSTWYQLKEESFKPCSFYCEKLYSFEIIKGNNLGWK